MGNHFLLFNLPPQIRAATLKGDCVLRHYVNCCHTGQTPPCLCSFLSSSFKMGVNICNRRIELTSSDTPIARHRLVTCLTSLWESPPLAWSHQRSIPSSCPSRRCPRPTARGRAGRRRHGGGSGSWPFPDSMAGMGWDGMGEGWEAKETWRWLFY